MKQNSVIFCYKTQLKNTYTEGASGALGRRNKIKYGGSENLGCYPSD